MTEKNTVFEMATKYYPLLWSVERIKALYLADKLSKDEYDTIINSDKE